MNKLSGLVINEKSIVIGNYKQLIHDRLKRLFFTPIDEMIGNLNKGSRIPEMIHQLADTSTANNILYEAELLIATYEYLIELKAIEVKTEVNEYLAGVIIKIDFYYAGTSIEDSVVIDSF